MKRCIFFLSVLMLSLTFASSCFAKETTQTIPTDLTIADETTNAVTAPQWQNNAPAGRQPAPVADEPEAVDAQELESIAPDTSNMPFAQNQQGGQNTNRPAQQPNNQNNRQNIPAMNRNQSNGLNAPTMNRNQSNGLNAPAMNRNQSNRQNNSAMNRNQNNGQNNSAMNRNQNNGQNNSAMNRNQNNRQNVPVR